MQRAGAALEAWVGGVRRPPRRTATTCSCASCCAATPHRYAEAKERESALDFDDLELLACRLLEENESLRSATATQFEHVLVDEFQDTNRLQIRLLRLLAGDDGRLFTVGDEFQSIYGFRHADVGVFRECRDDGGRAGPRAPA